MLEVSQRVWLLLLFAIVYNVNKQATLGKEIRREHTDSYEYAMNQRGLWAHRWFFETDLFPKTVLSEKEQLWWNFLGSYKEPGKRMGGPSQDDMLQADLDQLKNNAGINKRGIDVHHLMNRFRRQFHNINYDNMTVEEAEALFRSTWFTDEEKFPATELTDKQKEYMGLGAYGIKTLDEEDDTEDNNQREGCTYIDLPAWQRMEWRRMSHDTRQSFIDALQKLASFYPDSESSGLDIFIKLHRFLNFPGAIRGASLLPLNREYLFRFANALHEQGYKGELPYWDSTLENNLPDPSDSVIWTDNHLGQIVGEVGKPFDFIKSKKDCEKDSTSPTLHRKAVGTPLNQYLLLTEDKIKSVLSKKCYSDLTWMWDAEFETHINNVHIFFGMNNESQMADPNCAPNDPIFWLHSTFVDMIWEEYRTETQDQITRQTEYPRISTGFIPSAMSWYSDMEPFGSNPNIFGLSNHYTKYFYSYEERLSKMNCKDTEDCDPEMNGLLWCDKKTKTCQTKIREQGKCKREWPHHQCYCADSSQTPRCKKRTCKCK